MSSKIYDSQGVKHSPLSHNTSSFKNQLPQYAEIMKINNSKKLAVESPQLILLKSK